MIFFNNCDVRINGTGVMASTASVSTANPVRAMRSMGKNLAVSIAPDGPYANEVKMTYLLEIDKDPVFANVLDFIACSDHLITLIYYKWSGGGENCRENGPFSW